MVLSNNNISKSSLIIFKGTPGNPPPVPISITLSFPLNKLVFIGTILSIKCLISTSLSSVIDVILILFHSLQ